MRTDVLFTMIWEDLLKPMSSFEGERAGRKLSIIFIDTISGACRKAPQEKGLYRREAAYGADHRICSV